MRSRLPGGGGVDWIVTVQAISVVTLGIGSLERSRRFYAEGFGWKTIFENEEILFFQMNGLVLGLWLADKLAEDMKRPVARPGSSSLAHNVGSEREVEELMSRLESCGGTELRKADAPAHGGFRGYMADPDGHAWEIAYNPGFKIKADGSVTFGV